jgi:6-pyruvoyltetrahydropterin/6-carboxytetrahydropterin synthase
MYELSVEREFCAAHAITINGRREPTHGHNWRVTLVVQGDQLDSNGLLCDFHVLERQLDEVIGPLNNADLNRIPPFDRVNPTAEHVVKHIAEAVGPRLPKRVKLAKASVTEAPGCTATYWNGSKR